MSAGARSDPLPAAAGVRRFRRILFLAAGNGLPVSGLEWAIRLTGDRITGLTVLPGKRPHPGLEQEHLAALDRLAGRLSGYGIALEARLIPWMPVAKVPDEIRRGGHDLVIRATGDARGMRGLLPGRRDRGLVRTCPRPLWILRPPRSGPGPLLAAVDPGEDACEGTRGLEDAVMDLAVSLAASSGRELHVLNAWHFRAERALRSRNILPQSAITRIRQDIQALHRDRLRALMVRHPLGGIRHQEHLLHGGPARRIASLARERGADLIVLGTNARRGLAGLFIGNTAEKILGSVACSVLVVRARCL